MSTLNGVYLIEKFRDLRDYIEDKIRDLESSTRWLKVVVIYNAITNTLIVFLLWQLVTLLSAVHGGATAASSGTQQIAVVSGGGG